MERKTNLESLILKDLLDRNICVVIRTACEFRLEDDSERAISDDLAVRIGNVSGVTRFPI